MNESSQKIAALLVNIEPVPQPPPKSKKKFVIAIPTRNANYAGIDLIGELTDMSKSELSEIFGFKPDSKSGDTEKVAHAWTMTINGKIFHVRDWKGSWRQHNYMVEGPADGATMMAEMFGQYWRSTKK